MRLPTDFCRDRTLLCWKVQTQVVCWVLAVVLAIAVVPRSTNARVPSGRFIPAVINYYGNTPATEAAKKAKAIAALNYANKVLSQAGVHIVPIEWHSPPTPPAPGHDAGNDGKIATTAEWGNFVSHGEGEIASSGNHKGIKISFVDEIKHDTHGDCYGLRRRNVIGITTDRTAMPTGGTIAHEVGHAMGLDQSGVAIDGSTNSTAHGHAPEGDGSAKSGNAMATSSHRIHAATPPPPAFTGRQRTIMQNNWDNLAKCATQWKNTIPGVKLEQQFGNGTDLRNDVLGKNGPLGHYDIAVILLSSIATSDTLKVTFDVEGLLPASGQIDAVYGLGFDCDSNAATGVMYAGVAGIDRIVSVHASGDISGGTFVLSGEIRNTISDVVSALPEAPVHFIQHECADTEVPLPVQSEFRFWIPKSLLNMTAVWVPVVGTSGAGRAIYDDVQFFFDRERWLHDATLQTYGTGVPTPGASYPFSVSGLQPNSSLDLYLDGEIVLTASLDETGSFDGEFTFPDSMPISDMHFLVAQDNTGEFGYNITCPEPWPTGAVPTMEIEKTHGTIQGTHEQVDVRYASEDIPPGGFDFLVAYDASALGLQSAIPGPAFYDPAPDGCGWEYFTYRYGPFGNCDDACPSGMVRVFGLAETNNGPNHPSCFLPDSLPATLFTLDFLVSNDRTLECMYVPVRFFWTDCGDNSISSVDGEVLYVSDHVYEFEGTDITDSTFGFPTYFGIQQGCLNPDPDKPTSIQLVDYINGGVDIVCADSIDDRGDINLNGVVNEVADAVLYSNYFVHGISVFNVNIDGQIAASDVNADGITLSVADLVYMIRIITGDAMPYPKLTAITADADLVNGVLSVSDEMGAAYVVVESSIKPKLLAESMEMKYQYDADHDLTRILVYSMDKDRRFAGDFLGGIDGNVITLEMATYEGAPVTTKLVPDEFALYPSYPNPFNPVTTISFALASLVDYELVIYNSLGQTVKTFSGHSGPGLERIDWNASGFASGVYFYRLTAGEFTDTKKMVLLK